METGTIFFIRVWNDPDFCGGANRWNHEEATCREAETPRQWSIVTNKGKRKFMVWRTNLLYKISVIEQKVHAAMASKAEGVWMCKACVCLRGEEAGFGGGASGGDVSWAPATRSGVRVDFMSCCFLLSQLQTGKSRGQCLNSSHVDFNLCADREPSDIIVGAQRLSVSFSSCFRRRMARSNLLLPISRKKTKRFTESFSSPESHSCSIMEKNLPRNDTITDDASATMRHFQERKAS